MEFSRLIPGLGGLTVIAIALAILAFPVFFIKIVAGIVAFVSMCLAIGFFAYTVKQQFWGAVGTIVFTGLCLGLVWLIAH